MSKKITFGVIGLIGLGLFLSGSSVRAAETVSRAEIDAQTRVLLSQTLNVLQATLDQVNSRLSGADSGLENSEAVRNALGGIAQSLVAVESKLSGSTFTVAVKLSDPKPVGQLSGSLESKEAGVTANNSKLAIISRLFGPKALIVLLPLVVLFMVVMPFMKKRELREAEFQRQEVGAKVRAV
ncbi:MAG: hypothetical protein Q7S36_01550 [Candidatus Liptonbacteria bacterium]|nr:hypothetical protein [Candidatus Liptonbacteria bacterium]